MRPGGLTGSWPGVPEALVHRVSVPVMADPFSIRALVVDGQLAGVRPGDSGDTILARLGPPSERVTGIDPQTEIWRYGNFEIFLDDGLAYTLFHDWLIELEADGDRAIDPWILGDPQVPSRDALIERLTAEAITFVPGRDRDDRPVLNIPGGACLLFDTDEDTGVLSWSAIVVTHPDYATRFFPDDPGDE